MSQSSHAAPEVFGILHRRFAGDDALLRLAQVELDQAEIGAEVYPGSVELAMREWEFVPRRPARHMVHLPRDWDIFSPRDRAQVVAFARSLRGRLRGLVFHDRGDWPAKAGELAKALGEVDAQLATLADGPVLYLEYAAGIEPETFAVMLDGLAHLTRVSACIDTGHVTVASAQRWMQARHPGFNACAADPEDPALASIAGDLERAGNAAVGDLVALVSLVARIGKPLHFHLHDGHLLSRLNPHHVCDHLPFGERIPVSTSVDASGTLAPMLGMNGLRRVLGAVEARLPAERVSLTLEVHPTIGLTRRPLGERAALFAHWTDLRNAELTYAWLATVVAQARLVRHEWNGLMVASCRTEA